MSHAKETDETCLNCVYRRVLKKQIRMSFTCSLPHSFLHLLHVKCTDRPKSKQNVFSMRDRSTGLRDPFLLGDKVVRRKLPISVTSFIWINSRVESIARAPASRYYDRTKRKVVPLHFSAPGSARPNRGR